MQHETKEGFRAQMPCANKRFGARKRNRLTKDERINKGNNTYETSLQESSRTNTQNMGLS
jgi:hypothetical protein